MLNRLKQEFTSEEIIPERTEEFVKKFSFYDKYCHKIQNVLRKANQCEKKKEKLELLVDEKGFPSVCRISKKRINSSTFDKRFKDYFPVSNICLARVRYFKEILSDSGLSVEKLDKINEKELISIAKNCFIDKNYDKSEKDNAGNADIVYEYYKALLIMLNIDEEIIKGK